MTVLQHTLDALDNNCAILIENEADIMDLFSVLVGSRYNLWDSVDCENPGRWWKRGFRYFLRHTEHDGEDILAATRGIGTGKNGMAYIYDRSGQRYLNRVIPWANIKTGNMFIY